MYYLFRRSSAVMLSYLTMSDADRFPPRLSDRNFPLEQFPTRQTITTTTINDKKKKTVLFEALSNTILLIFNLNKTCFAHYKSRCSFRRPSSPALVSSN